MNREQYGSAYGSGFRMTVRFLKARGASPDRAEEMAQAAWSRGWERLHQLRDEAMVVTWANSIALNLHRSSARRDSRTVELSPLAAAPPSNMLAQIDVTKILDRCGKRDRNLLAAYYLNGRATSEIARESGLTETAVRLRLMRARRFLLSSVTPPVWNSKLAHSSQYSNAA